MTRHNDTSEALAPLAAELLQIAKSSWTGYDAWASDETMLYFDSPHEARVLQLGEQANRIGGLTTMKAIHNVIGDDGSLSVQCRQAMRFELTHLWAGIGQWQP
jgi:hypothetical protein